MKLFPDFAWHLVSRLIPGEFDRLRDTFDRIRGAEYYGFSKEPTLTQRRRFSGLLWTCLHLGVEAGGMANAGYRHVPGYRIRPKNSDVLESLITQYVNRANLNEDKLNHTVGQDNTYEMEFIRNLAEIDEQASAAADGALVNAAQ